MSRELRLTATGERLVWWRFVPTGGLYLSRESRVGNDRAWFAGVEDDVAGAYSTDDGFGGVEMFYGKTTSSSHQRCEETLINAGVAYVLNIEDDDGAFPSD